MNSIIAGYMRSLRVMQGLIGREVMQRTTCLGVF